jgi:L-proline amide hydrolase
MRNKVVINMHKLNYILILLFIGCSLTGKRMNQLEYIDLNGEKQAIYHQGNLNKSIVLFIHGGPGSPLSMFSDGFEEIYRKNFHVIHWDQWGTGKSFSDNVKNKNVSIRNFVDDGVSLINFLHKKYNKKIILIGHSWGTILARDIIKEVSNKIHSLILVGTVVSMSEGDLIKYRYLGTKVKENGEDEYKSLYLKLREPPWSKFEEIVTLSQLMWKFNGVASQLKNEDFSIAIRKSKHYTEKDFMNNELGMMYIYEKLAHELNKYDVSNTPLKLDVKTYFVQGDNDVATPTSLVKNYYESAKGKKKLVIVKNTGHFPMYENPELFLEVVNMASQDD